MKRRSGALSGVLLLLAFAASASFFAVTLARRPAASGRATPVRVTIARGMGPGAVGALLERKGIIRSALVWERFVARGARVQPGTYDLSPAETPERILRRLVYGQTATLRVTFPEGFTVAQMARRLESRRVLPSASAFETVARTRGNTLPPVSFAPPADLEGYLFPDTYRIPVDTGPEGVAAILLENFDRRVARGLASEIAASGRSLREIVIVASLVEREARTDRDRPLIAGVVANRLRRGMRLEIDATVQYARGQHKSRLLYRDLEIDSPYNTYRRAGLPPGPICNPGLPSIRAAIQPARHDFLFYVLGPDGRNHVFSRTFAEHRAQIARRRRS